MSIDLIKEYIRANGYDVVFDACMQQYTTLKIGGNADILVQPRSVDELCGLISCAKLYGCPVTFIGNGSNLLVRDKGIRGLVIKFGSNFSKTVVEDCLIEAQSGISMARLASVAADNGLSGFEFASGIPGTLGGGIMMNAGAYKGEMKDCVVEVTALEPDGTVRVFDRDSLDFSYRHSCFTDTNRLILSAKLKLEKDDPEAIYGRIRELSAKRRKTQPLEYPSAGSAFKRPETGYAAAMIDACGLKGFSCGGAQVSEKHAGFVINFDHATAQDVEGLLHRVQDKVNEQFHIMLEPEIVILGE